MNIDWGQSYNFLLSVSVVGGVLLGATAFFLRKSFPSVGRFEALERRVETLVAESAFDELEKRVSMVERAQDGNASAKELGYVALALEKLNGTTGRLEERLDAAMPRDVGTPEERALVLDGVCELLSIADSLKRIALALEIKNPLG